MYVFKKNDVRVPNKDFVECLMVMMEQSELLHVSGTTFATTRLLAFIIYILLANI